ncbi:MAG: hypothetical protein WC236_05130 [Gallionellaceae bacterium]
MDLIGSIKLIENTLSRRFSNQSGSQPAAGNTHLRHVQGKSASLSKIIFRMGRNTARAKYRHYRLNFACFDHVVQTELLK